MGVNSAARAMRRRLILVTTASVLAMTVGGTVIPRVAMGQTLPAGQIRFDIPAQDLNKALLTFTDKAGLQIFYDLDKVAGKRNSAVHGNDTPIEALSRLLAGTGLTFRATGNRVTLEPVRKSGDDTIQIGPVQVEGAGRSTSDPTATEGSGSYAASRVSIGKENARLIDIPQSITAMTRQQLDDRNVLTLPDALQALTGVTAVRQANANAYVYSRGFQITKFQTDGGATQDLGSNDYFRGLEGLGQYDHVELLRGSDALFSGSGDPGGTVNLVRKRPLAERSLAAEDGIGSWNNYRGMIDFSTPLLSGQTRNDTLGARLIISNQDRERAYQPSGEKRLNLYGILEYKLPDNVSVRVGGSRERLRMQAPEGARLPRYPTGEAVETFSPRTSLAADWEKSNFDVTEGFVGADINLADKWTVSANASVTRQEFYSRDTYHYSVNGQDRLV